MTKINFPNSPTNGQIFGNWIWNSANNSWDFREEIEFDETTRNPSGVNFPDSPTNNQEFGSFIWNSFKSVWNWNAEYYSPDLIEYLVIAGGGGSGGSMGDVTIAGGGGAGGYRSSVIGERSGGDSDPEAAIEFFRDQASLSWSISVGAGGAAGNNGTTNGSPGGNSSFGDIVSTGGGYGNASEAPDPPGEGSDRGGHGGSGGGAGIGNHPGGLGTAGQGFFGGPSAPYGLVTENDVYGGTGAGGGGGSGSPGFTGQSVGNNALTAQALGHYRQTKCSAASTVNVNLASAPATIDGVTLTNGMRVLLKDQTNPSQNGIYTYNSTTKVLSRAADMDASGEFRSGAWVEIEAGGSTWGGTNWGIERIREDAGSAVVGVSAINFVQNFPKPPRGGDGGRGTFSSITGSPPVERAGGGGGGGMGSTGSQPLANNAGISYAAPGGTGYGGGGNGRTGNGAGNPGTANTGGGAGGSSYGNSTSAGNVAGAAGGSGVVIIRYPNTLPNLIVGAGLTYRNSSDVAVVGNGTAVAPSHTPTGYKVYRFTLGSGTVTLTR